MELDWTSVHFEEERNEKDKRTLETNKSKTAKTSLQIAGNHPRYLRRWIWSRLGSWSWGRPAIRRRVVRLLRVIRFRRIIRLLRVRLLRVRLIWAVIDGRRLIHRNWRLGFVHGRRSHTHRQVLIPVAALFLDWRRRWVGCWFR